MNTKIYYVDDDEDDLVIFGEICAKIGVDVNLYLDAVGMLEVLLSTSELPSIIFVDVNMPLLSGYEVIKKIKANKATENIPIVMLSTANDKATVEKCQKLGANFYITKPTTMQNLYKAIDATLRIDWTQFH